MTPRSRFGVCVRVVLSCGNDHNHNRTWCLLHPLQKVCVQHVEAAFCGSVGSWKSAANKRCYTGCQKYMKSILPELQKQLNMQVQNEHINNHSCKTAAKYSNDIHLALWPPEQHQPVTGGPVAPWPCSYSSMFPRQMPRQTLHINRKLLWGLFFFSPPHTSSCATSLIKTQ